MNSIEELKNKIQSAYNNWKTNVYTKSVNKAPEREKEFTTASFTKVEPLYYPEKGDENYIKDIGAPGEFPFTRGIQPTMYRGRFWTMRQYAGFGSAAETNKRFKYLLENGQTGLSVAFDLPTQMGMDSDHSLAAGEVGKVGVAIDTLQDMEA